MRFIRVQTGQWVEIDTRDEVGTGGEARVVGVRGSPGLVAKLFHQPTPFRTDKLRAMLANPPADPHADGDQPMIAWPVDLLSLAPGAPVAAGFLMPRLRSLRKLVYFYNPKLRQQFCPQFGYPYLLRMARNMATAVGVLHDRGYVIGDVNESNVLGSDRALVTWVDTDSLQVRHNGSVFRCTVGKPEFTPPELQGVSFHDIDRAPHHDAFGLGVLIFQLLMEGAHPFDAAYTGSGDPPAFEDRIRAAHFPHAGLRLPYRPKPHALPFDSLAPALQGLFIECFARGHDEPRRRPAARLWQSELTTAEARLKTCRDDPSHRYGDHLTACPWCRRARELARPAPPPPAPPARASRPAPLRTHPRPTAPAWLARMRWPRAAAALAIVAIIIAVAVAAMRLTKARLNAQAPATVTPIALAGGRQGLQVDLGPVAMTFALIAPGSFEMGSPPSEDGRGPNETQHRVTISKAFYMSETLVAQSEWEAVMGRNPSHFKGSENPVETVSWNDALEFCRKMSEKTGRTIRLPTEAEWEYACRAGTTTAYYMGDGEAALDQAAWYSSNSDGTHAVGEKKPNAWDLYDMHGNVEQWCNDWYGDYPPSEAIDPTGPAQGSSRVVRGGSWFDLPLYCRAAYRNGHAPDYRSNIIGFRVCLDFSGIPLPSAVLPSVPSVARQDSRISDLLARAKSNDSKANGVAALGALAELLKLDPSRAEARALQAKIAGYFAGSNQEGMKFALIPPGSFQIGSPASEAGRGGDETLHAVTIGKPYYLGVTDVTQAQWSAVMGNNPSHFKGDDLPVETVSWNEAMEFCRKLSARDGKTYRLPTEAEWEYACRAGTTTPYYTGGGEAALGEAGWYSSNSDGKTHPVSRKKPNAWGLYDMHGNVWQWCNDWYGDYPQAEAADPTGSAQGSSRVLRGGSWSDNPRFCRAAFRGGGAPGGRSGGVGFRVCLDVSGIPLPSAVLPSIRAKANDSKSNGVAGGVRAANAPDPLSDTGSAEVHDGKLDGAHLCSLSLSMLRHPLFQVGRQPRQVLF